MSRQFVQPLGASEMVKQLLLVGKLANASAFLLLHDRQTEKMVS